MLKQEIKKIRVCFIYFYIAQIGGNQQLFSHVRYGALLLAAVLNVRVQIDALTAFSLALSFATVLSVFFCKKYLFCVKAIGFHLPPLLPVPPPPLPAGSHACQHRLYVRPGLGPLGLVVGGGVGADQSGVLNNYNYFVGNYIVKHK